MKSPVSHHIDYPTPTDAPVVAHHVSIPRPDQANGNLQWLTAVAILKRHYGHNDQISLSLHSGDTVVPVDITVSKETTVGQLTDEIQKALNSPLQRETAIGDWIVSLDSDSDASLLNRFETVVWVSSDQSKASIRSVSGSPQDVPLWASSLAVLVSSVAGASDQSIAMELEFVDEAVKQEMLDKSQSRTEKSGDYFSASPSREFTFPHRFELQVAATPDRVAAIAADPTEAKGNPFRMPTHQLSYCELNARANQVAWWLMDQGIHPRSAVGVYMGRSPAMLAVLIGIMKAGCHYVPMSTELPVNRLSYMTDDASVRCIVTDDRLVHNAAEFSQATDGQSPLLLNIDDDQFGKTTTDDRNHTNPTVDVTSDDLAYVIYTSGSTGMPKGVQIRHHSFVNFCLATNEMLGFTIDDIALAITTTSFDVSITELYPLLMVGGQVVVADEKVGANGELFSSVIEKSGATYLCATPTSLRVLVASGWQASPDVTVLSVGEPISRETCNVVAPRCKRLINAYGPTEATVYSTYGQLEVGEGLVTIGRSIPNVRNYILDSAGRPVPPMVHGELFIGGEAPARGYLNRPELNEKSFVPDPFADAPDSLMYATGDVCFVDHDGNLFCLGRSDHQVKIRGYRIELGEIESRLKEHDGVKDAVVIAREDNPDEKRLVAYVVPEQTMPADRELQDFLATTMPDYMVPAWYVPMEAFAQNLSGKLDRKQLPKPEDVLAEADDDQASDGSENDDSANDDSVEAVPQHDVVKIAKDIAAVWTKVLGRKIRVDDEVFRMGADSLKSVSFQIQLEQAIGVKIPVGEIFQYRTPELLAERIGKSIGRKSDKRGRGRGNQRQQTGEIAIVGMAGRFPGAANLDQFWQNLADGVESIRDFSTQELQDAGVSSLEYRNENYVPRGTVLDGAWDFDPEFFGITRAEAELISPQIRLFMQTAYETLEHGGYAHQPTDQTVGVFAGAGYPNYLDAAFGMPESQRLQVLVGNGTDYIATRTAFALGLTGPAVSVQTACSTALVAVAEACAAIRAGRCDMAVAGGVSFSWPQGKGYQHGPGLIYSRDGHCRAFDSRASGTLFSHGVGAVLLKSLEDAVAGGDTVHAVIRGIATNNDGSRKGGFASPSIEGQQEVIEAALADSDLSPEDISYVEAHGTATKIGDPIEIAGLTAAWSQHTDRKQFCAIGSVKTNIGHTDAAAGIAGLLKVVLSIKHGQLPATLHYESPNPEIDFAGSPFRVQDHLADWTPESGQRIAAISAFGLGGTNAHAIVSQPPETDYRSEGLPEPAVDEPDVHEPGVQKPFRVIPISARTDSSLEASIAAWRTAAADGFSGNFQDMVFTLRQGRPALKKRSFAVADCLPQHPEEVDFHRSLANCIPRDPVFMFTGQGSQYVNMAFESYRDEPVFRNVIEKCDALIRKETSHGLTDWLYPNDGKCVAGFDVNETQFAQLAIFSCGLAQAQLWMSWGIEPVAMVGHSIGETIAATVAEVMTLESAISIVAKRATLMQSMKAGAMVAIMQDLQTVQGLIADRQSIEVAVVNSRTVTVVGGQFAEIETLEEQLKTQGIRFRRLKTSHAFHSAMMEPMLQEYRQHVASHPLSPPRIPIQSNVTGTWMTDEQATSPDYYAQQVRSTVRFADNVASILSSEEPLVLLEMGAGAALTQMAGGIAAEEFADREHTAIATTPAAKAASQSTPESSSVFANRVALGHLWASGTAVDWDKIESWETPPHRIPLPTYQFDLKTYRRESNIRTGTQELPADQWFHVPAWTQEVGNAIDDGDTSLADGHWLVIVGDATMKSAVSRIEAAVPKASLQTVHLPHDIDDFEAWQRIVSDALANKPLAGVIHAATLCGLDPVPHPQRNFEQSIADAARSVTWLAKALGEHALEQEMQLVALTSAATNGELSGSPIYPANHSLIGTLSVIQKEVRSITTRLLNFDSDAAMGDCQRHGQLAKQISSRTHHPLLAWQGKSWWRQTFETISIDGSGPSSADDSAPEKTGVFVVTGGLGEVSLGVIHEWVTQGGFEKAHFILLGRNGLPERGRWDAMAKSNDDETTSRRIRQVQAIERAGGHVEVVVADCSIESELIAALQTTTKRHGKIDAVLHTAGVLRDGAIASKQSAAFSEVYRSKVDPAFHLAAWATKNQNTVGRIVFFSSISADMGLFGQVDYSGANNVLDGLSASLNMQGVSCVSINWPAIVDVGMASRSANTISADAALARELKENSLFVSEAAGVLATVLATPSLHRVAIARTRFEDRRQSAILDGRESNLSSVAAASVMENKGASSVETMLQIWQTQFGNEDLTVHDDYFDMGGDSLMAVGMIARIEQAFGKVVPISHLINSPTVDKLTRKLGLMEQDDLASSGDDAQPARSKKGYFDSDAAARNFVKLKDGDISKPPLILLHGADGAVMFYREFSRRLNTDRAIFAIEAPFLGNPEEGFGETVEAVATGYVDQLVQLQSEGPYVIAGYSYGGVVAYAMTVELESRGQTVENLIVFDIGNPARVEYRTAIKRLQAFWKAQDESTSSSFRKTLRLGRRTTKALKDRATREIEHRLAARQKDTEIDSAFWRHKKARKLHMEMEERYVPVSISAPLGVVIAKGNSSKFKLDQYMGWGDVASDISTVHIEGSHLELFDEPWLKGIVDATTKLLDLPPPKS